MNFVIDASVALSWCFEDEGGDYAVAVLEALNGGEAVAASLWPLEIANGLIVAERRQRIEREAADRFVRLLLALPIAVDPAGRTRALDAVRDLARRHALSAYDAAYLELGLRLNIPLATLDRELRDAAGREGLAVFGSGSP